MRRETGEEGEREKKEKRRRGLKKREGRGETKRVWGGEERGERRIWEDEENVMNGRGWERKRGIFEG